jgi:16S rRNA (uracil1498-N3)-methyltransferase
VRRFHHPDVPASGSFPLPGDEGEHLVRVLRARPGDEILVFDGRGREVRCRVVTAERRADPVIEIVGESVARRPRRDVVVCTAVPRGERMEWLVEKCVEAGASAIVPWAAARSVRESAGANTLRRWRRAALEACKQCGRADVPDVADVVSLGDALGRVRDRVLLVADPAASQDVESARDGASRTAVFVGPEGGFEPAERAEIGAAGARPFGLGPLVLRIETAAAIAVHRAAN